MIGTPVVAKQQIYLCFNSDDHNEARVCRWSTDPLFKDFTQVAESNYGHINIQTSCSKSE